MQYNKVTRTFIPILLGYLTYYLCNKILEVFIPIEPIDDHSTPGVVFLIEYILILIWWIIVALFQYMVIVPKTIHSTRKATIWTVVIGFAISLLFSFLRYLEAGALIEAAATFIKFCVPFESFFLGNIATIAIFNSLTKKATINSI